MKLARYKDADGTHFGLVANDKIHRLTFDGSAQGLIAAWDTMQSDCAAALEGDGQALSAVALLALLPRPGKVFAIGLNYADHIEESGMDSPSEQIWFTKAVTSVNGPFDPILIPKVSQTVDYEAEMVAIIGKKGKNLAEEDVAGHIFGYCVGNDVTERMWQHRTPQWSLGKSFDTRPHRAVDHHSRRNRGSAWSGHKMRGEWRDTPKLEYQAFSVQCLAADFAAKPSHDAGAGRFDFHRHPERGRRGYGSDGLFARWRCVGDRD